MSLNQIYKHVFLEYSEYQRLLELKKKNELLQQKINQLQKELTEEKRMKQDGSGLDTNLSARLARKDQELETPQPGILNSITFPPSARLQEEEKNKTLEEKWYYLGMPSERKGDEGK